MSDFKEPKNLQFIFKNIQDIELPSGFDTRFQEKFEKQNRSWTKRWSIFKFPGSLGWAVGAAATLLISFKAIVQTKPDDETDVAVKDEIDMLDNLDVLDNWDDDQGTSAQ